MSNSFSRKPLAVALGAAFAVAGGVAHASSNPFVTADLPQGYQVVGEGKCGAGKHKAEGKCGADKAKAEGKCGSKK